MTVLSLTFVHGGADILEHSVRNNLQYVDHAYFVLGPNTNQEEQLLRKLALNDLPVNLVNYPEDQNIQSAFQSAVTIMTQAHGIGSTVIILEPDDMLNSSLHEVSPTMTGEGSFTLPRHIAFSTHENKNDSAPGIIRKELEPSSYALGFHIRNSNERQRLVDDRFTGYPVYYGSPTAVVGSCSVVRFPVRSVDQFIADTANGWIAVEARAGVSSAVASTAGAWLTSARELVLNEGADLTDEVLWSWLELQITRTDASTVTCDNVRQIASRKALLSAVPKLLAHSTDALNSIRDVEQSTRSALRRERLLRLHDSLTLLLSDHRWHRTWVWKDRATVMEFEWNNLLVAFDVFITSDEITIQLVSRKKAPIPGIGAFLDGFNLEEVKVPGKPGRYVLGAIPVTSTEFSTKHVKLVANIIRPIVAGMGK